MTGQTKIKPGILGDQKKRMNLFRHAQMGSRKRVLSYFELLILKDSMFQRLCGMLLLSLKHRNSETDALPKKVIVFLIMLFCSQSLFPFPQQKHLLHVVPHTRYCCACP
jgi:hypothetical protein